jgi:hypothetical protein
MLLFEGEPISPIFSLEVSELGISVHGKDSRIRLQVKEPKGHVGRLSLGRKIAYKIPIPNS